MYLEDTSALSSSAAELCLLSGVIKLHLSTEVSLGNASFMMSSARSILFGATLMKVKIVCAISSYLSLSAINAGDLLLSRDSLPVRGIFLARLDYFPLLGYSDIPLVGGSRLSESLLRLTIIILSHFLLTDEFPVPNPIKHGRNYFVRRLHYAGGDSEA